MNILVNAKQSQPLPSATLGEDVARAARLLTLRQMSTATVLDIRQPLSVIAMDCSAALSLLKNPDLATEQLPALLNRILESVGRAEEVISAFDQTIAKRHPDRRVLDVDTLLSTAVHYVSCESISRGISIQHARDQFNVSVAGDSDHLHQVFVGVLVAVMQSVDPAGGSKLRLSKFVQDARMCVEVRADRRVGLGTKVSVEVFGTGEEDERIASLAACEAIAKLYNGEIEAVDRIGEFGFDIRFPVASAT
jgi:C4-dicarboxylate-specific signal transduction histidine kinase